MSEEQIVAAWDGVLWDATKGYFLILSEGPDLISFGVVTKAYLKDEIVHIYARDGREFGPPAYIWRPSDFEGIEVDIAFARCHPSVGRIEGVVRFFKQGLGRVYLCPDRQTLKYVMTNEVRCPVPTLL